MPTRERMLPRGDATIIIGILGGRGHLGEARIIGIQDSVNDRAVHLSNRAA